MELNGLQSVTKLTPTGYPLYAKQMRSFLRTKGFEDHITYADFNTMYLDRFRPTEREELLLKKKDTIQKKVLSNKYSEDDRMEELLDVSDKLAPFMERKTKEEYSWIQNEQKIKGYFEISTEARYHLRMNECKTSAEIWKRLKIDSNQEEAGNFMAILTQFYNLKYQPGEKLSNLAARAQTIAQRIVDQGGREPSWKEMVCFQILSKIPPQFDAIQQAIFQLDWEDIHMDLILKKFNAEDARQDANRETRKANNNVDEALLTQQQRSFKKINRKRENERKESSKKAESTSMRKCQMCQKPNIPETEGEWVKRCAECHKKYKAEHPEEFEKKRGFKSKSKNEESNLVQLFNLADSDSAGDTKKWYLDCGCTNHVTNSAENVGNLKPTSRAVSGPSGEIVSATHVGNARVQVFNPNSNTTSTLEFQNALVVPKIKKNLVSVRQITAASPKIFVILNQGKFEIFEGEVSLKGSTIAQGQLDETNLYAFNQSLDEDATTPTNAEIDQTFVARTLDDWHDSLCHINKKAILQLKDATVDFQVTHADKEIECTTCDAAKMNRKKFARILAPIAKVAGEVITSDVCGKISPPSLGGCQYIVSFIDRVSGYIFAFLIKNKSDTAEMFKVVNARVKNLAPSHVKVLATDGGGEYIGKEMQDFLKAEGISHSKTPPNTHERVGLAERFNGILFGAVRAMLRKRKMPRKFWGLCALYYVYVRNRTVKPGAEKTRYELLRNEKPSLKHCLPFGCLVMYHNHDPHIKKLDARAFKGVFVGFDEDNHAYMIWDQEKNQLFQTRDIKPYPDEFAVFADYQELPFEVEDDNNWATGEIIDPKLDDQIVDERVKDDERDEEEREIQDYDIFDNPIYSLIDKEIPENNNVNNNMNLVKQQYLTPEEIFNINTLDQINTPKNYKEAMKSPHVKSWKEAMEIEIKSLVKLETFELVPFQPNMKVIKGGFVYKIKTDQDGKISKFKARCVAKGYSQEYGIDYFDTFSPTLRYNSFRYVISVAQLKGFKIHHLDVQTAFLNGELAEEIYMHVPEGFESLVVDKRCTHVLKLKKSLYGLKQAGRVWNEKFTATIIAMGFFQSAADPCIFYKFKNEDLAAVIAIFVDDCFVLGKDEEIESASRQLKEKFEMHDLGLLSYGLSIKVEQNNNNIKISQPAYVDKLLEKFNMQDCSTITTPLPPKKYINNNDNKPFADVNLYQQLVGGLIYLSNATRPDIAYSVGYLARSMQKPTEEDWKNGKRVLRYLKGTRSQGIQYNNKEFLQGYSDSSYAEEIDRKSVGGYVFKQAGGAFSWRSTKQDIVAQSSSEAEYIALAEAVKEALWIRKLQAEMFPKISSPTTIFEDNQSTINLAENPIHTNRSKHIDVRFHATRNYVADKKVVIIFKPTAEMIADIMTKSLERILHEKFVKMMGLVD